MKIFNSISIIRILVVTLLVICLSLSLGHHVFADTAGQIRNGVCDANGGSCPANAPGTLSDTITTIINILSAIVGIAAVVMLIIGGLRYVTSAGNAEQAKNARNTVLYALVGLVIVALAQLIVHFVLHTTSTGTKLP